MKKRIIAILSVIFVLSVSCILFILKREKPNTVIAENTIVEKKVSTCKDYKYELYKLHSEFREAIEMPTFTTNKTLELVAELKVTEMIKLNYWAHENPITNEISTFPFMEIQGYDYYLAGENISRDNLTPGEAMNKWINSPTHRENIDGQYEDIGIYTDCSGEYKQGRFLTVVVFGKLDEEI